MQLRNFYEIEKDRMERRISEERENYEQRYQQMIEETEAKQKEESQSYEEEIQMLKDEIRETDFTI